MSVFFYASGAHALVFMFLASIAVNYAAGLLIARYKDAGEASRAVLDDADRGRGQPALPVLLEVRRLRRRPGRRSARPRRSIAAARHLVLHVPRDQLRGRRAPRARRGRCAGSRTTAQYMAFFPQLIAGPIVRYHEIDDQIRNRRRRARSGSTTSPTGFPRFALGLTQEGGDRRPAGAGRRRRVRPARRAQRGHRLAGRAGLHGPDLLRLLGLHATWRSGWRGCSASASRRTSTGPTRRCR